MRRALVWLNLYGREAVRRKLKNSLKTQTPFVSINPTLYPRIRNSSTHQTIILTLPVAGWCFCTQSCSPMLLPVRLGHSTGSISTPGLSWRLWWRSVQERCYWSSWCHSGSLPAGLCGNAKGKPKHNFYFNSVKRYSQSHARASPATRHNAAPNICANNRSLP